MTGAGNLWLLEVKLAGIVFPLTQCCKTKEMRRFLGKDETKYLDKWRASVTKFFREMLSQLQERSTCSNAFDFFHLRLLVLFFPLIIRFKTGFTVLNAMLSLDNNVARFCFSCLSS